MRMISHYTLLRPIASGTETILYHGYRNFDKKKVAIKIAKGGSGDSRSQATLRHEYSLLNYLPGPGLMRALALEQYPGGLALILEDLDGKSLEELIRQGPLPVPLVVELAIQLTQILEKLHNNNIIHKDIKPANVLIDFDPIRVCIIDVGIATMIARESQRMAPPNALEGTLSYLSPEQTGRMNRFIDRRTDFYSLGVTLFAALAGQLPFLDPQALALIHAHVARRPPSLRRLRPEVPEALAALVDKLLEKAAEDRYQSAAGLRADLLVLRSRLAEEPMVAAFPLGRSDWSTELHLPQKLYGREAEAGTLVAAFERVATGSTELFLVTGPAGIGKSALVHEVHKAIARRGGVFVAGKFELLSQGVPYASLAQALRELVRQLLTEQSDSLLRWKDATLEAVGTSGQLLISLLPELEQLIGPQPSVPEIGPTEAQNRFERTFQRFVRVFSTAEHPLVVFLDDLQWADAGSLRMLKSLVLDPEQRHLLLIGSYRDTEVDATHPLSLMLRDLKLSTITSVEKSASPFPGTREPAGTRSRAREACGYGRIGACRICA